MSREVNCSYCTKSYKPSDSYQIKFCGTCEMWCCRDCVPGVSSTKCPKCEKETLK